MKSVFYIFAGASLSLPVQYVTAIVIPCNAVQSLSRRKRILSSINQFISNWSKESKRLIIVDLSVEGMCSQDLETSSQGVVASKLANAEELLFVI